MDYLWDSSQRYSFNIVKEKISKKFFDKSNCSQNFKSFDNENCCIRLYSNYSIKK